MTRAPMQGTRVLPAFLLLACLSCEPDDPTKKPAAPQDKQAKQFEGEDILAAWVTRFQKRPPGSFDSDLPKLEDKKLREVVDRIFTALATGRSMQRYAKQAQDALHADPRSAIAGLAAFLADGENDDTGKARALALFAGKPHPLLTSLCLQHLDDKPRLVRWECVRRLDESKSLGNIPRLLRRTREFYEEDPEILSSIFTTLARIGNLSGLETLLTWLDREDRRALAGTALIDIAALYGDPYAESDGWAGLARKCRGIHEAWKLKGSVAFADPSHIWTQDDLYHLSREYWLFLRHLNGKDLRVVDETRYIGQRSGLAMIELIRESLRDRRLRQRFHALEILIALGRPGKAAQDEVRALLDENLTRSYALNAYGCIDGDGALEILLGALRPTGSTPSSQKNIKISALAGLTGLESPAAFPVLQDLFAKEQDAEIKAWTARAWIASSRGAKSVARQYLQSLLNKKAFHEATLLEMLREAGR